MQLYLDLQVFGLIFLVQLRQSELFDLSSEYDSVCTLLPQKSFVFHGSNKKVSGRELAKVYTQLKAVGNCMSLCAKQKHCNAVNFRKTNDTENCLLINADRDAQVEDGTGWLAYITKSSCIPGCYRNAGRCQHQVPITEIAARNDDKTETVMKDRMINRVIEVLPDNYDFIRISNTGKTLWFRLSFGKVIRVARVILYIPKLPNIDNDVFSIKVGMNEQPNVEDIVKDVKDAIPCVNDVSKYPGKFEDKPQPTIRKDVYCYRPIEGRFVYLTKRTISDSKREILGFTEVLVFGEEKM